MVVAAADQGTFKVTGTGFLKLLVFLGQLLPLPQCRGGKGRFFFSGFLGGFVG